MRPAAVGTLAGFLARACGGDERRFGAASSSSSGEAGGSGGAGGGASSVSAGGGGSGGTTARGGAGRFDPAQDPTTTIKHPADMDTRTVNQPIPYIGSASDPQVGPLAGPALVWTSDGRPFADVCAAFLDTLSGAGAPACKHCLEEAPVGVCKAQIEQTHDLGGDAAARTGARSAAARRASAIASRIVWSARPRGVP